ncbi:hypothetical protein [Sphingomonas radiodurans]|uniref:hypothetical protein n=1 Tax=Sphingomonas radiodurans TaxID=2890321 RepID=UPI001E59501F|nr:hypothetical protein [Sphingomonas radiodurans]WBH15024.1 hypothetical protein LLW23_09080 [Sphingomonas radiodurans]
MKPKHVIAGAILAMATMASQPATAYTLTPTGRTLASPQLAADVLRDISSFSKATGGCSFVFSVHMTVLPRSYTPVQPSMPAVARGGHFEQWSLNACGARQRFQIAMWPSPRGGTDYAITPLTGRMSLAGRR